MAVRKGREDSESDRASGRSWPTSSSSPLQQSRLLSVTIPRAVLPPVLKYCFSGWVGLRGPGNL